MRMVLVLPAPLGPRKPKASPGCTSKSTASTAVKSPKRLVRPRAWISGAVGVGGHDPMVSELPPPTPARSAASPALPCRREPISPRCAGPLGAGLVLVGRQHRGCGAWPQETASAEAPRPTSCMVMIDDANPHDGRLWSGRLHARLNELIVSPGHPFHRLPRRGAAVRPVARQPAHRPARPQQRRQQQQRGAARRLDHRRHRAGRGRLPHRLRGQVPQRLPQVQPASSTTRPAGRSSTSSTPTRASTSGTRSATATATSPSTRPRPPTTPPMSSPTSPSKRIREAPDDEPLFALIAPFTPARAQPAGAAARGRSALCRRSSRGHRPTTTRRTSPTSRPTSQELEPLGDGGFDLTAHCESLLAVDELIGRVGEALEQEGRLDDTVFIFIADNGMTWGEHRRMAKVSPYATAMPAYAAWPAARGAEPRDEATTLSMIDFAPTLLRAGRLRDGPISERPGRPRTAAPSPRCWPTSPCRRCATRCCTRCPRVAIGRCGGRSARRPTIPMAAGTTSRTATASGSSTTSAVGSATSGARACRAIPASWTNLLAGEPDAEMEAPGRDAVGRAGRAQGGGRAGAGVRGSARLAGPRSASPRPRCRYGAPRYRRTGPSSRHRRARPRA